MPNVPDTESSTYPTRSRVLLGKTRDGTLQNQPFPGALTFEEGLDRGIGRIVAAAAAAAAAAAVTGFKLGLIFR